MTAENDNAVNKKGISRNHTNWSYDRYQSAVIQRNIMILLNIGALVGIFLNSIAVTRIAKNKTLEPFIIEVDNKSGLVTLLDQDKIKLYTANDAVNRYFIMKYIRSRELFDTRNYRYLYYKESKLLSSDGVYRSFVSLLRSNSSLNPMQAYAGNSSCDITVRSIHYLKKDNNNNDNTTQVRFTVTARLPNGKTITKHKIATLNFTYIPVKLSEDERHINPLGFQITSYNSSYEVV